jgi:hypothetical protein
MSTSESSIKYEEAPTLIIEAPPNYEQTHELTHCPLCNNPIPVLDMHVPIREFGYFDMNLYTCETMCQCAFGAEYDPITDTTELKPHKHKFSVKHEILTDAEQLKIYDRTHVKNPW